MAAITLGSVVHDAAFGSVVATETLHAPGLRLPTHDHEPVNLTIVLEGGFEECVGSDGIACMPGTALLKPQGAHHSNAYGSVPVHCLTLAFHDVEAAALNVARHPSFQVDAYRLRHELLRRDPGFELAAESLAFVLLGDVTRARIESRRPRWIDAVEERLREEERITVAALARAVGRHPSHMAREFRRHAGCTLGEYQREVRFARVCAALRSERPLIDIALDAGFADQAHFTNAFRRRFGVTPKQFRAQDSFKTRTRR